MSFDFSNFAEGYVSDLCATLVNLNKDSISVFMELVQEQIDRKGTVHFIGNGGSAGNPSHSAGDWSKELGLATICHTDNIPALTAWANDTGYENIFKGSLSTFLRSGDLVVAYSGSGNSENIINGILYASEKMKCKTVGITGNYQGMSGGKLAQIVDVAIVVESESMERIEDSQLVINHIVKEAIKSRNSMREN